jgi:hypothetical protein
MMANIRPARPDTNDKAEFTIADIAPPASGW